MKHSRTTLLACMIAIQAILTQCLAFTFTFTGTLTTIPSDGIIDINGTITVTANVHDIVINGVDAGEHSGNITGWKPVLPTSAALAHIFLGNIAYEKC